MKLIHRSQIAVFLKACSLLAVVSIGTSARAQEMPVAALKAKLEGAYALESWTHANGDVLRPPAVDARAVLINGRIMFIAHDRGPDPSSQTTIAGFGTYTLEPGKYSYGYERYTVVSRAPGGTLVSETLPWEGMRTFAASIKDNELRLRAIDGPQELRITAERLTYSDGEQTRVYRRVTGE
jgi:hypothetical protein